MAQSLYDYLIELETTHQRIAFTINLVDKDNAYTKFIDGPVRSLWKSLERDADMDVTFFFGNEMSLVDLQMFSLYAQLTQDSKYAWKVFDMIEEFPKVKKKIGYVTSDVDVRNTRIFLTRDKK